MLTMRAPNAVAIPRLARPAIHDVVIRGSVHFLLIVIDKNMISRSGFIVPRERDLEKALTVTPEVNSDYAPRGISFKVFRRNKDNLCIPQHYGKQHVGAEPKDKRPEPVKYEIPFKWKTSQGHQSARCGQGGPGIYEKMWWWSAFIALWFWQMSRRRHANNASLRKNLSWFRTFR